MWGNSGRSWVVKLLMMDSVKLYILAPVDLVKIQKVYIFKLF